MNNSIYGSNASALIDATDPDIGAECQIEFTNNILYQAGTGACAALAAAIPRQSHNLYYAPNGTIGVKLTKSESDRDPGWVALPSGPYKPDACRLAASRPGVDLSKLFTMDFDGAPRSGWDVGAREFREEK